ncbi:hypothetical protein NBG98_33475 [Burkholderia cenocepacia]|uniref:hypothetical protein n=1 Tax=Burkholderia cenocepacia TaxID=95486 RepID=UPI00203FAEA4|nr:hypothetical protein [Burkholderia cenocepacia]USB88781.1 hypothetical protein NBG98_33475 [Burkholderia cenocepacia]
MTIKGFISIDVHALERGQQRFHFFEADMTRHGFATVAPHEFDVEVADDLNVRAGLVANLEREKNRLSAEYKANVNEIDGRIQTILSTDTEAAS